MHTIDLVISLAEPSPDAPLTTLAQLTLTCPAFGAQRVKGILADPLDDALRADLSWYLEESWQWPFGQFAHRAYHVEQRLEQTGRALYDAVFDTASAQRIVQPWNLQPNATRQISLELLLSEEQLDGKAPVDPRVFTAMSLPWELLHDGRSFLALRPHSPVALVRRLPEQNVNALLETFTPPLRVLLVTARPSGAGFVDPRSIARPLYDAVEERMATGELLIEYLRPPTLAALVARLGNPQLPPVHILHFDGHGIFLAQEQPALPADGVRLAGGGQGALAFENDQGGLHLVKADDLANVLGQSGIKLAVLTACQSAVTAKNDAFSSVAGRLIKSGVDAVIAMSASLLVATATKYVKTFYQQLASSTPVLLAHAQAHQQLNADPRRHVLQRTKDDPGEPVALRDWWVPQVYQQRPLHFAADAPAQPTILPVAERTLTSFPGPPRYGFGGRALELLELERELRQGRLVLIHGFGGQGKTALASEAADWLTRTGMYCGALFVSLEGATGTASWLLAEVGRHLGCYDGAYDPDNHGAALARLRLLLRARPTLIVLDNLETILPRGEAPLSDAQRVALWDTVLSLRQYGAGMLLTVRGPELGDRRLQPGQHVRYLHLHGLSKDDAYALASRLLEAHGIPRERAPYPELIQLLAQLDHHPLAIELVLPMLARETMGRVLKDFSALLGRFMDVAVPGRNQSLLASLQYSLQQLTVEQRELLSRLAIFENGALELSLLTITKIPEKQWQDLRQSLEQAALITAETAPGFDLPFLRFHPVLAPALRAQATPDWDISAHYAIHYAGMVRWAYEENGQAPANVREVVLRELPNLRRALALMHDLGDPASAAPMANRIASFLNAYGLGRERDAVRRQQEEATKELAAAGGVSLTKAEFLQASGQGDDAFSRGDLRAAHACFTKLLARIEQQPPDAAHGPGSYEHCMTLARLARCLQSAGQPVAAEATLRRALHTIDRLLATKPENSVFARHRGVLYSDLGIMLSDQRRHTDAQEAYEQAERIARQQQDRRLLAATLGNLGMLVLQQGNYGEAERRYREVLKIYQNMGEPAGVATSWHELGIVAEMQKRLGEAERCYRESLVLRERLGDGYGVASTCGQLGNLARLASRPSEAEGWYRQAMKVCEQIDDRSGLADVLSNYALMLTDEIQAGRMSRDRLPEARDTAERALAIQETLDLASEPWKSLHILAELAEMEGQPTTMNNYRRRARETFAQFAGNRLRIDQEHGALICSIAAACQGDEASQNVVVMEFPEMETKANWGAVPTAVRALWEGERDWHVLADVLVGQPALLILRVLETLADPAKAPMVSH